MPAALAAYDKMLKNEVEAFSDACKALGGDMDAQRQAFVESFEAQRKMLEKALRIKKPTMQDLGVLAADTHSAMHKVEAACEAAAEPPATFKPHTRMVAGHPSYFP